MSVPCSDANIFPEYVLPALAAVSGIRCFMFCKVVLCICKCCCVAVVMIHIMGYFNKDSRSSL
jgi:hypothetical protein